ncbi:hypothetical protein V8E55_008087 [Tylopilus felleus]
MPIIHQLAAFNIASTMPSSYLPASHWTTKDQLAFIRNVFNETEVICQWIHNGVLCSERIKAKDFRAHLTYRHCIAFDAYRYPCQWHRCSSNQPMRRGDLERHMRERHVPFRWACPYCDTTFTRESNLLTHMQRVHGYVSA